MMRAAIVMLVLATRVTHAETGDCPPAKSVALAHGDNATTDEMAKFETALAPKLTRHCSAAARKLGQAWPAAAAACFAKATTVHDAHGCLGLTPTPLRAALLDDAAATFPYSVEPHGGELVIHGPFTLAHTSRALDALAAFMKANPSFVIEVRGYTAEAGGGPARLRAEAKARADDARAYLIKAGVDGARLIPIMREMSKPKIRASLLQVGVVSGKVAAAPITPPSSGTAPPPAPGATPKDRARHYYSEGEKAYALGDFDKAIANFEASYAELPHAAVLYNLGQAYKQKKDKPNAIRSFEAYLQQRPTGSNAGQVQQMIDDLRKQP